MERFFMNVVLVRVLYAHALVAAPRLAMGWLAPLGRPVGDPRVGMTGIFLSLSRILPDRYPLGDDVDSYVAVEHGFGRMLDVGVIQPRIGHLYGWSARELGTPALCDLLDDDTPAYAWDAADAGVLAVRAVPTRQGRTLGGPGTHPSVAKPTFAAEREPAVLRLLYQPVDKQRIQRPVALRGVRRPRQVELAAGNGKSVGAQHIEQPTTDLTVGARVALRPPGRTSARREPQRPPRAVRQRTQPAPRRARRAHRGAQLHQRDRELRRAVRHRAAGRRRRRGHAPTGTRHRRGRARPGPPPVARWCRRRVPVAGRRSRRRHAPCTCPRRAATATCRRRRARHRRARRRSPSRIRGGAWPVADNRACPTPAAHRPGWRSRSPTGWASVRSSPARSVPPARPASAAT